MRKSISLAVIVALAALPMLTACKSKTKRSAGCSGAACAPPPAPIMADAPGMMPPAAPMMVDGDVDYAPPPTSSELAQLRNELDEERAKNDGLNRRLDGLASENTTLRSDVDRLADELAVLPPAPAMQPDLDAGPAPAPATDGTANALATYLGGMSGVEVSQRGDGSVVVFVTDAFRSGSDKLKGDMRLLNALRDTAAAVNQHAGAQIHVVGHTDTTPIKHSGWESNTALSMARANTVAGVLQDNGVSSDKIQVDGMGEMQPLVNPERSSSDRARNRRVEIVISL